MINDRHGCASFETLYLEDRMRQMPFLQDTVIYPGRINARQRLEAQHGDMCNERSIKLEKAVEKMKILIH